MVHLELNLNPEIEKRLFETINFIFNGSYEKFIENSLMLMMLAEDKEDILLICNIKNSELIILVVNIGHRSTLNLEKIIFKL